MGEGGTPAADGGPPLVVCVGDLMLDVGVTGAALAAGGDVGGSVSLRPGGAAANVAVWARAAGAAARLVARRGDDLTGSLLLADLRSRGVDLHPREPAEGATGAALVVWAAGERSFVTDAGVNRSLRVRHVRGGLAGANALYLSGYPLTRAGSRAAVLAAARDVGSTVPAVVDAASWPLLTGAAAGAVLAAAACAGTLLADAAEATALSGKADPDAAARALAARAGVAVVKLGARGVLVAAGSGTGMRVDAVPAEPAEAVDATGAGDAFAAGFLTARAGGAEPVEAARAGVGWAARAVGVEGAWPS